MIPMPRKRANVFAIVNQKGGVGKTTTAVNLATALAATGKRVLVVDLDPQGNASTGLGIDRKRRSYTSYDVLIGRNSFHDATVAHSVPHLYVVPATVDLSGAELELVSIPGRECVLRDAMEPIVHSYDFIFIDCPPSLGLLTLNAMVAANRILVPLQCEFYALEGLSHLIKTIDLVKKRLNPSLEIAGVVLTMYDRRNRLTSQIERDVRAYFGSRVYHTVVPRNVRVSEAPSHGLPALLYDLQCTGSQAYALLAREVLRATESEPEEVAA
jgi:chromosome partitioning protein